MIQLQAKKGLWNSKDIYLGESILLKRYDAGDCDTIHWPFGEHDRENLASALYDEFEMGNLKERTVLLPDGSTFNIDENLA